MTERTVTGVMYAAVDGTTWPIEPGRIEWELRYAPDRVNHLVAASIVAAYAHLVDPAITQADAIAALKRARRARVAA